MCSFNELFSSRNGYQLRFPSPFRSFADNFDLDRTNNISLASDPMSAIERNPLQYGFDKETKSDMLSTHLRNNDHSMGRYFLFSSIHVSSLRSNAFLANSVNTRKSPGSRRLEQTEDRLDWQFDRVAAVCSKMCARTFIVLY